MARDDCGSRTVPEVDASFQEGGNFGRKRVKLHSSQGEKGKNNAGRKWFNYEGEINRPLRKREADGKGGTVSLYHSPSQPNGTGK